MKLSAGDLSDEQGIKLLPERLRKLIERSKMLQTAIRRLDDHACDRRSGARPGNPVERQLGLLKAAFERNRARPAQHRRNSGKPEFRLGPRQRGARRRGINPAQWRGLIPTLCAEAYFGADPANFF